MNILTRMLTEKIQQILNSEVVTEEENKTVTISFLNPSGGKPVRLIDNPLEDYAIILNKTPRYYPREAFYIEQIQKNISAYAAGKTVSLDYTDNCGNESKIDRLVKSSDMESLTPSSLLELVLAVGLLNSVELEHLLVCGGTVNIHYWNRANDFSYRQTGSKLEKIISK